MPVFERQSDRQSFLHKTTADTLGQLQSHVKAGLDKAYRDMMKDLIIDAEKSCSIKEDRKPPSRSVSALSRRHALQRCETAPVLGLSRGKTGRPNSGRRPASGRKRPQATGRSLLPSLLRAGEPASASRRPSTADLSHADGHPSASSAFPAVAGAGNRPVTAAASSAAATATVKFAGAGSSSSNEDSGSTLVQAGTATLNSQNSSKQTSKERLPQLVWVARANNLSLETCKQASDLFRRFTSFPDGHLNREQFHQVLTMVLEEKKKQVEDHDVDKAFAMVASEDSSRNKMNFSEFALWYSTSSFDERMCINEDEKEFRVLCRKYNMDMHSMERYRRLFSSADADGSGVIEEEEFNDLLRKCAKVPGNVDIPAQRFRQLWKECDLDGGGSVDFEEFLDFYSRYFEDTGNGVTGFESFYRNVRPALGIINW